MDLTRIQQKPTPVGFDGRFLQAAERALWIRYGWKWFSYWKLIYIMSQDETSEKPTRAQI
ncbi:MAG: hypothetical protein ABI690_01725 [Chloroflexota bacterium]